MAAARPVIEAVIFTIALLVLGIGTRAAYLHMTRHRRAWGSPPPGRLSGALHRIVFEQRGEVVPGRWIPLALPRLVPERIRPSSIFAVVMLLICAVLVTLSTGTASENAVRPKPVVGAVRAPAPPRARTAPFRAYLIRTARRQIRPHVGRPSAPLSRPNVSSPATSASTGSGSVTPAPSVATPVTPTTTVPAPTAAQGAAARPTGGAAVGY